MADGYPFVGEGGTDVFLLATGGDMDAEFFERLDVAANGAGIATENLGEIFLGEQSALVAGFLAETSNTVAAQHFRAADLVVTLAHEAEGDAGHGAVFECDASTGLDLHAGVKELAVAQWRVAGRGEIDFADDFDDDLSLPRAHAGAGGDFVDHALVLCFGCKSACLFGLRFLGSDLHGGGVFVACDQTHNEPDRPPVHQHITTSTRIRTFQVLSTGGQVS